MRVAPFDRVLLGFSLAAIVALGATFPREKLTVLPAPLVTLAGVVALLVAVTALYTHRGAARHADVTRLLGWTLVLNVLCSLLFYLPVRAHAHGGGPLADGMLARADAALGFSSASLVAWARSHPAIDTALGRAYESLEVFGLAAVAVPPLLGHADRAKTLVLAIVPSAVLTLALAAVWPGVGPWEPEGFVPTPAQVACGDVVHALASGAPYVIDLHYRDPIIVLPSWHTIFAVLGALVWRPFRFVFPVALAWAGLIVLSTLTTGWHYLVDVLAGGGIALAVHFIAGAMLRALRIRPAGAGSS